MPNGAMMAAAGRITKQPALQPIPANVDPSIRQAFAAIHETLNIAGGIVGNPLDSKPTFRDLVNAGVVQLNWSGGSLGGNGLSLPGFGTITQPGDLTPPPAPTGLAASGAIGNVMLTWDTPTYGNHAYTEIWRHQATFTNGVVDSSVIGNAQRVGSVSGYVGVYADTIGAASDCWYWIRFVSTADVTGPYNAVAGVRGTTVADPAYLIDLLTGSLGNQPLYQLSAPTVINGVTIPAGVYMKVAYIQDGAITNAKIGNAAVDTAKIADLSVSAAKIADLAVSNAKIQDAAITTAKIGLAQISTALIASAAITNAKIGDAAVNTLKLAGQAVTIPVSASSQTQQGMGTNLSCTLNSTGAPIAIVAAVSCTCNSSNTQQAWIRFAVYRDGVFLADAFVTEGGIPTGFGFVGPLNGNGAIVITDSTAGAGIHTYTVVTSVSGSALSAVFNSGGINIMEVKR